MRRNDTSNLRVDPVENAGKYRWKGKNCLRYLRLKCYFQSKYNKVNIFSDIRCRILLCVYVILIVILPSLFYWNVDRVTFRWRWRRMNKCVLSRCMVNKDEYNNVTSALSRFCRVTSLRVWLSCDSNSTIRVCRERSFTDEKNRKHTVTEIDSFF